MQGTAEMDDARVASAEAAMREQGVATEESVAPADYFGFDETNRINLPDGVSWIEHRVLNEGQRKKYQNASNRDVKIQKVTGDAVMRMAPGDERHALLKTAITGWQVFRGGQPVPFSSRNLDEFLEKAPPKVVDLIEKEIRKANPWLLAEVSVEDIDKEIAELTEMRAKKLEEEEAKAASSSR